MNFALLSAATTSAWGKKAEAAPAVRSFGFTDDQIFEYGAFLLALSALHAASLVIRQPSVVFKAVKAADAAHLGAHFVASLVAFACFAVYGTQLWVLGASELDACGDDHISGYCAGSGRITIMMMAFQSYEVLLALYVPKLRGPTGDMLVHHIATLALATLGGGYQYLHFYAPFFFGLTEISSVPLAFMDLFKFFDELKKKYPAQNELSRTLFVAIFIPVRLVYWPYVCSEFWMDSIAELQAAQPRQPVPVVATFLVANILLTGLQFFWGALIAKGIVKKIKGKPE